MRKTDWQMPGEAKKTYRKPELRSHQIELGVYGCYHNDDRPNGDDDDCGGGGGWWNWWGWWR